MHAGGGQQYSGRHRQQAESKAVKSWAKEQSGLEDRLGAGSVQAWVGSRRTEPVRGSI